MGQGRPNATHNARRLTFGVWLNLLVTFTRAVRGMADRLDSILLRALAARRDTSPIGSSPPPTRSARAFGRSPPPSLIWRIVSITGNPQRRRSFLSSSGSIRATGHHDLLQLRGQCARRRQDGAILGLAKYGPRPAMQPAGEHRDRDSLGQGEANAYTAGIAAISQCWRRGPHRT